MGTSNTTYRGSADRHQHARFVFVLTAMAAAMASAQGLDEITVTAERRETALQDTPISILAFGTETLTLKGVEDMEDLATIAPNLDIKGSRGTGNVSPTYQIRGISGAGGALGERGVGFYMDNVFMSRQTGPFMRVLDLERIEVLRGPQGTLFGRNSVGGAIRVFTKQPSQEREGYLRVVGGNFSHYEVHGMLNTPVTDDFAIRGQVSYMDEDGYVDRGTQSLGSSRDFVARLRGQWDASPDLSVNFGVAYSDSKSDGNPQDLITFDMSPADPNNPTNANAVISFQGGYADWMSDFLEAAGQPRLTSNDPRLLLDDYSMPDFCFIDDADPDWDALCEQVNKSRYFQADATVTWEVSDNVRLTSTTGYTDFKSEGITDWQLLGMERRPSSTDSWTIYQEFQLNTSFFDERLDFVTGVSYFHEKTGQPREYLLQSQGTSTFWPVQRANGNGWVGNRRTGDTSVSQKADSLGWFASGTWHVTDRVNFTGGVRVAYDAKDFVQTEFRSDDFTPACMVALVAGQCPSGQTMDSTTVTADDSWTAVDWRATIDTKLTDDHMVYATVSKAYRAGAYSYTIADRVPGDEQSDLIEPIPPEKVINYEVGARTEWFDQRLRFNLSWFYMQYSNRQNPTAVPDNNAPTGFVIRLVNQGNVNFKGWEVDGQWAVTDKFIVDGNAGWIDYDVKDKCTNNGLYLFPAPSERGWSVGGRYLEEMSFGGQLTWGINYSWVGPQHTHPGGIKSPSGCPTSTPEWFIDSRYKLPSYGLLSARLRYETDDGRWVATLFGNNLTDETYGNFGTRFGGGYWEAGGPPNPALPLKAPDRSAIGITRGRPLEWGVSLQFNFY